MQSEKKKVWKRLISIVLTGVLLLGAAPAKAAWAAGEEEMPALDQSVDTALPDETIEESELADETELSVDESGQQVLALESTEMERQTRANYILDISNGTGTAIGNGVTFSGTVATFNTGANGNTYTITGTTATNRIVVPTGVATDITLAGVDITNAVSPFRLTGTANVNLTLATGTTNVLNCTGVANGAGNIQSGLHVPINTTITIDGTGELLATGGSQSAGIGGAFVTSSTGSSSPNNSAGTITINSGKITASGGGTGAGIGGGRPDGVAGNNGSGGSGGTITINGGTVTGIAASGGAGIGGGARGGRAGTITITGGTVTGIAAPGWGGAGIGCGSESASGTIIITGGTVTGIGGAWAAVTPAMMGAGIGASTGGASLQLTLQIDAAATVKAYSEAPSVGNPAILARTITGSAYYVNGFITGSAISTTDVTELKLYTAGAVSSYDSLELPVGYRGFAYTTGSSSADTNIRAYNSSGTILGAIVYTANGSPDITPATQSTVVQQVRLGSAPVLGALTHSNVTDTTADLTSTGHSFTSGTLQSGTAFYYNTADTFTGSHLSELWTAPGASPYTRSLTNLASNTMYYYRANLVNEYSSIMSSASQQFLTLPQIDDTKWGITASSATATVTGSIGSIVGSQNGQSITGVTMYLNTTNNFSTAVAYPLSSSEFTDTSFSHSFTSPTISSGQNYYVWIEVSNATGALGGSTVSTDKQFQLGYTITEKYVDETGATIQPDTTDLVATSGASYTYGNSTADIVTGGNTYILIGYQIGSFTIGATTLSVPATIASVTSNQTVYLVYHKLDNSTISVTYPTVSMDFHVDETTYPNVEAGIMGSSNVYYTFTNNSDYPLEVEFNGMTVNNSAGLNFVPNATASSSGSADISLDMELPTSTLPGTNGFSAGSNNIDPALTYTNILGTLDGTYVSQAIPVSDSGYITIGGYYAGNLSSALRTPQLTFTFTFRLVP